MLLHLFNKFPFKNSVTLKCQFICPLLTKDFIMSLASTDQDKRLNFNIKDIQRIASCKNYLVRALKTSRHLYFIGFHGFYRKKVLFEVPGIAQLSL